MSIGTDRVRVSFNPSSDAHIDDIKRRTAELIDLCDGIKQGAGPEQARLAALAMTQYEDAAMWAVKAATASVPA